MKLYLAGPMRGIPFFNYPAFHQAAAALRDAGHHVFSPAERDGERHGGDISNPTGSETEAARLFGFSIRAAMEDDLVWICRHAEGIALLPGWDASKGAQAERALGIALGLTILELP